MYLRRCKEKSIKFYRVRQLSLARLILEHDEKYFIGMKYSGSDAVSKLERLGNREGVSYGAIEKCEKIFDKLSMDDWKFYLEYCMSAAENVLYKLTDCDDIRDRWINIT